MKMTCGGILKHNIKYTTYEDNPKQNTTLRGQAGEPNL
jgi:hypothetical protein